MTIPRVVQKQAEEADKLQKDLIEKGKTGPDAEPAPGIEQQDAVKEEPKKEEKPKETPAAPEAKKEPPAKPPAEAEKADWEQRYKVLQGKYNAEIRTLNTKLTDATTLLAQANTRIGELENRSAPAPQAEPKPSVPKPIDLQEIDPAKIFTEEELGALEEEGFDASAVKIMAKINAKLMGARGDTGSGDSEVKALKSKVEKLEKSQEVIDRATFDAELTKLVPDWKIVNGHKGEGIEPDQNWYEWLEQIDPFSGLPRQQLLNIAAKDLDVKRVAQFFNSFKALHPSKYGQGAPSQPGQSMGDPLEKEIVPEGGKPPSGPEPKVTAVTGQQYLEASKAFALKKLGEEEFRNIEKKYLASQGIGG